MKIKSVIPENTCCDMRDSWNIISKFSNEFWVIVHWPSWCENEFFFNDDTSHSFSYSTWLNEYDITIWTWYEKLKSKIEYVLENNKKLKVLFILWTCSSELVWDFIDNLEELYNDKIRIIVVHTSWMRWSWYHYTKYNIFKSLFWIFNNNSLINNWKKNINIFFQDWMQNNLFRKEIKYFLAKLGINVVSFLNSSITYDELSNINKVDYNFLIWKDEEFEILLKYINKDYNINYSILDLPLWEKKINIFYSNIYFTFFNDKKKYILEYLKYRKKINDSIYITIIQKYFYNNFFVTNSNIYLNILKEFKLNVYFKKDINYPEWINSSHKFNYDNKIFILDTYDNISVYNWYCNKTFSTINKYMGFVWKLNFFIDLKNQKYYNNFLKRYNKYI